MASLKKTLASGGSALGSWLTLPSPAIPEIMANAGYSWLAVDMEHASIDLSQCAELMRAASLAGAEPLVRLPINDPVIIKRVMDAGAHGIVVPMVNTADEARAAVAAMHYPPRGVRGVGLFRAQGYGATFPEYKRWLAEDSMCIVQIEHIEAVKNLEEILAVDGVDGYIIGPYDLSASLGVPGEFDRPEVQEALAEIEAKGPKSGKAPGIHIVEPDLDALGKRLAQGYRFVAFSLDIRMLDVFARQGMEKFKQSVNK
ncbi:HpcH/HpaI aldolase [Desulfovibrio sp. X2]|uniref:HpcH/HpaI aldolase family protein n=1 Tax=Desulfovibrio sp. X2 TaxID=941449 RepID=UPI000358DD90|nr:aldolase/citrate lyase family protein [Desulfovibrio sp. X2]EPR44082.1 HpcH/HpaI aldolase [Desulfovibrio sp. X2]